MSEATALVEESLTGTAPVPTEEAPEVDVGDFLAGSGIAVVEPTEEPPTETAEPTTDEPTKEPEPEPKKGGGLDDESVFGDEALSTVAGIKKAATVVKNLQVQNHRTYLGLSKREERFKRTKQDTLAQKQQNQIDAQRIAADVTALYKGDARQSLEALGRIRGTSAVDALEALNLHIGTDGKNSKTSPEVAGLKEEIQGLRQYIDELRANDKQAANQHFLLQQKAQLARAASNEKLYPLLSRFAREDPGEVGEHATNVITQAHARGERVTYEQALQAIEQQLQRKLGSRPAAPAEPVRDNGAAQAAEPRSAQSPPLGTQIAPTATTQGASRRDASDSERELQGTDLPDEWWAQNFGV